MSCQQNNTIIIVGLGCGYLLKIKKQKHPSQQSHIFLFISSKETIYKLTYFLKDLSTSVPTVFNILNLIAIQIESGFITFRITQNYRSSVHCVFRNLQFFFLILILDKSINSYFCNIDYSMWFFKNIL